MKKRATFFFHSPAMRFLAGGSVRCIRLKGEVERGKRGCARRWFVKKRVTFFFHSPAMRFSGGGNVCCIRLKGEVERGKRGCARR